MKFDGKFYGNCIPCNSMHVIGMTCPNNPEFNPADWLESDGEEEETQENVGEEEQTEDTNESEN